MLRNLFAAVAATALLLTGLTASATANPDHPVVSATAPRPVVFVHGYSGSGNQFESQAQRFAANGYPADWIETLEYDSTFETESIDDVHAALDRRIADLTRRTGADQVDLLGHSLGTLVAQRYLKSTRARAATVAHYVNLDGLPAISQPGRVPTLAIWGEGNDRTRVWGAKNVHLSDQGHTETVTSVESFTESYRFFTGNAPATTDVVPQDEPVEVSGRAVLFPSNVGIDGVELQVHTVDGATGQRTGDGPVATYQLRGDGSFGPFVADPDASYEFALLWEGSTHHIYHQPFRRTNTLVRLLSSVPGSGLEGRTDKSADHVNLTVNRNKEWWGDQGAAGDRLTIDDQQVVTAGVAPRERRIIGLFAFDAGSDGRSDLTTAPGEFASGAFITAVDAFIPAAPDGQRPVRLVSEPRGEDGQQELVVPAWPSDEHRISVQFDDFL